MSIIGKVIDGYRVERLLGQGGMAAVYEVVDLKLQRQVAMKVMHEHLAAQRSFRELFVREAQNAARLDHPNIVKVFGFNISGDYLYMLMEMITGGNLRAYVKRLAAEGQFIDYPEAAEILRQIAAAVDYAHSRGMVHRDLKPDNIMLKPLPPQTRGLIYQPIVTDFGLAQLITLGEDEMATAQQPIGTYPYMSPEQVNAEPVDHRTDIYALGIILYELTVGRLPFNPRNIAEAAKLHGQTPVTPPSDFQRDFPEPLERIILKCLAKVPSERYASGAELVRDLTEFIHLGEEKPRSKLSSIEDTATLAVSSTSAPAIPTEITEVQTNIQTATLGDEMMLSIPNSIERFELDEYQKQQDYLALYSFIEESFLYRLEDNQDTFTIGRELDDDIVLRGDKVSRDQATIERKPNGKYYFTDPGSTNGSYMDGKRLEPNRAFILRAGMVVRMGDYWMEFLPRQASDTSEADALAEAALIARQQQEEGVFDQDTLAGEKTRIYGIAPASAMPEGEPPRLTSEQLLSDRLIIYRKNTEPQIFLLTQERYTIGRDASNELVLASEFVSRRHAILQRGDDGRYMVQPYQTTNGTWEGVQLLEPGKPSRISARYPVRIGDFWLVFEAGRNLSLDAVISSQSGIISRQDDSYNDKIDTIAMVRPLDEEPESFNVPPMSEELLASDRLIFYGEDQSIQIEKLNKEVLTVGRGSNQDIRLGGKRISRDHALFEIRSDGNIYITDLDSRNGVWMGDTLLVPQTSVMWLRHETLRIANYWVKFQRATQRSAVFGISRDTRGLIGKTIGIYRIDNFMGETGIATTYKATDLQLERDVALKVMLPQRAAQPALKQRFLDEARTISRLDHPNVVRVMSYNEIGGEVFMVMEFIDGGSLRGLLTSLGDAGKRMEVADAGDMIVQLSTGLHYAHQQGLIHRDINPGNIVLKATDIVGPIKDYTPVLTDFTSARVASADEIYEEENKNQDFPYMSPEQVMGQRNDARSDIYELGITFYEMLIGQPPFMPRSLSEAVRMHTREQIPKPSAIRSDITPELEAVILRALARDPNDRFQTAIDFARSLQRALLLSGKEVSGVSGVSLISSVADENVTEVMDSALPRQMPFLTQPPIPIEEIRYDRLVFYSEENPTKVVNMTKAVMTVGRAEDQDVVLPSRKISRRQARIERSPDGTFRISDMDSANGTYLGAYKLIEQVIEIWDTVQTVRMGDYWVRLETIADLEEARARVQRVVAAPLPDDDAFKTGVEWSPPKDMPPVAQDKISVTLSASTVTVAPGSSATISAEIMNRSDVVEHFSIDVMGLPPDWYTKPHESLEMMPYNRNTCSVTFHPPLKSRSTEGAHAFEIRVSSHAQGVEAVRVQGSLVVLPFYAFKTEIYPERVRNRSNIELSLRNEGNKHTAFQIQAKDREQLVAAKVDGGQQYTLAPGKTEDINIRVEPRRRPLFGNTSYHQLELTVTPIEEGTGLPQTIPAELVVTPRMRLWMIFLPLLLLLLCAGLATGAWFLNQRQIDIRATSVAIVQATDTSATATAVVFADDDGDRLSNIREGELGTLPDDPDTDKDGISDGDEVLIYGTNPLQRDTDGDGLSDGEEILVTGTDPLRPDTDGDGITDPEDPFPLIGATAAPTLIPTLEAGADCPGSPSPSRMAVGDVGFVEAGGVANRLREEPTTGASILGFMPPNAQFVVLEGPVCDQEQFLLWWKVDFNGTQAWTAEGEGDEYYLRPEDVPPAEGSGGGGGGGDAGRENFLEAGAVVASLPDPGAALDPSRMGIQIYSHVPQGAWNPILDRADPLEVGWVKIQVNWNYLQPDAAKQTTPQLEDFYSHVRISKARGYRVLLSIAKAPNWARSTTVNAGPPDDPEALVGFINEILANVGGAVDAVEVWNEPNLSREWTGLTPFSGAGYMSLFLPAYDAIKSYNDSIVVVSAGLAPAPNTESSVSDRDFLRQMYASGLADLSGIAVGVHPYGWANAPDVICCTDIDGRGFDDDPSFFFLNNLVAYRNIMLRFGDDDAPMWITEFGYSTWEDIGGNPPEVWQNYLTGPQVAQYTRRAFEVALAQPYIGNMILWNLNFANSDLVEQRREIVGFSLTTGSGGDLSPRPAYNAFLEIR